jgi:hypothetical protein
MRGGPHTWVLAALLLVVTACTAGSSNPDPEPSTTTAAPTSTTTAPEAPVPDAPSDLILHNGQILTVDQDFTIAGAVRS